jgi:hypothetical protein
MNSNPEKDRRIFITGTSTVAVLISFINIRNNFHVIHLEVQIIFIFKIVPVSMKIPVFSRFNL